MDSKNENHELQQRIDFLEKKIRKTKCISAKMLKVILNLEETQVFKCKKNADNEYVITYNEGKLAQRYNITTKQIKGKRIKDIIGNQLFSELKTNYEKAFSGEIVSYKGFIFNERYFTSILAPFKRDKLGRVTEIIGRTQDIHDKYLSDIEKRKQADILDRIIKYNPYSIQILDSGGYHIAENQAFINLFKAIPDKSWSILSDQVVTLGGLENHLQRVLKGEMVTTPPIWYNAHLLNPDFPDNPICIGSVIFPIFVSNNKLEHIVIMHEDITSRIKAEEELVKAKDRAEESERLKSAFLANMSHEIRTPMNGILGFADLLKTPNLTGEKQQRYIKIIQQSGERMLNIINDLINISKLESGQMEITLTETDIDEQLDFLYNFFEPSAKEKGIHLVVGRPVTNSTIINTDTEKVYAVFTNLIRNAIKFTNIGKIEFGYGIKNSQLEFFVKDSGIGISPDKQTMVFERFVQADPTITNGYEGSGLGLSIAKAYIEMLGGKIWVESKVGKGTNFYFTIPDNHSKKSVKPKKEEIKIEVDNNKKINLILVVEDDDISSLYLSHILMDYCDNLIIAKTGEEAVEICRNNPDINLVFMDIKMPVMDGHVAAKIIKEFRPNLTIIAQTAFALEIEKEKYKETFDDYITKPIKGDELLQKIEKYKKQVL